MYAYSTDKKINTKTRMSQNCHSVPSGQGIIRCRNDSLGKHCTAGETKKNIVDVVGNQKKICIFEAQKHIWNLILQKIFEDELLMRATKLKGGNLQKESFP